MGLNGSGKSTLLKLVSGVMQPRHGLGAHPRPDRRADRHRRRVRPAAHRVATTSTSTPPSSGCRGPRPTRKFDEIVDFADLGKFLDTQVAYYSSGMKARLGFSVAVNVDADIFIADEVLAVGDRPFKRKCKKRMDEIVKSGVTMFYVSHAPGSVRNLCSRVLVLENGRLAFDGDVDEGIAYLHYDDDEPDIDEEEQNPDDELGADI